MTTKDRIESICARVVKERDDHKTAVDFCAFLGALKHLAEGSKIDTERLVDALDRSTNPEAHRELSQHVR